MVGRNRRNDRRENDKRSHRPQPRKHKVAGLHDTCGYRPIALLRRLCRRSDYEPVYICASKRRSSLDSELFFSNVSPSDLRRGVVRSHIIIRPLACLYIYFQSTTPDLLSHLVSTFLHLPYYIALRSSVLALAAQRNHHIRRPWGSRTSRLPGPLPLIK